MPPKAKAKAAAEAKSPAKAPPPQPTNPTPNAGFLSEVEGLLGRIGASTDFGGFHNWKPLGVGDGGSAAVFDLEEFRKALENGGEYVCCGNYAWLDWKFSTAPGVPVLRSSVASYAEAQFNPKANRFDTLKYTVAVEDPSMNPLEKKGALQAVSPQEEVIAPLFALGQALKSKSIAGSDAQKWRECFSSALLTFKLLETKEEKEFETIKMRQEAAHKFVMISYTPVQWVYKINQMQKEREQKLTSAQIAALFTKHQFKAAQGQEEISVTFVENATYIGTHGLCYPEVTKALVEGAELYSHKSMFDSVSKIAQIIRRCKMEPKKVKWVFTLMLDRVRAGHQEVADFSSNAALFGTKDAFCQSSSSF